MQPRDHARLVLARDRALAAALSRNSAASPRAGNPRSSGCRRDLRGRVYAKDGIDAALTAWGGLGHGVGEGEDAHRSRVHRQLDRYAYGPPPVRFTDDDVDRARAAGGLIEFERGRPIVVDRPLYRELVKTAIKRTHDELQAKAETVAKDKKTTRARKTAADPITAAKRERDTQLRELTDQAHGANSDLGHALVHSLAAVDPTDLDVAPPAAA